MHDFSARGVSFCATFIPRFGAGSGCPTPCRSPNCNEPRSSPPRERAHVFRAQSIPPCRYTGRPRGRDASLIRAYFAAAVCRGAADRSSGQSSAGRGHRPAESRGRVPSIPPTSVSAAGSPVMRTAAIDRVAATARRGGGCRHEAGQAISPLVWILPVSAWEAVWPCVSGVDRSWTFDLSLLRGRAGVPCRRHPLGCVRFGPGAVLRERVGPRHVWMVPWTQGFFHAPVCRINCSHVSGLSSRHETAGPDGIRGSGSDHALGVAMPHGEEQVSPNPSVDRHCHHALLPSHFSRHPHASVPERAAGVWGGYSLLIAQPSGCRLPRRRHPAGMLPRAPSLPRRFAPSCWPPPRRPVSLDFGPQQLGPPCIGRAVLPAQHRGRASSPAGGARITVPALTDPPEPDLLPPGSVPGAARGQVRRRNRDRCRNDGDR